MLVLLFALFLCGTVFGLDCSDKPDGLYPLGFCMKKYAQCLNGRSYDLSCGENLAYNPRYGACVLRSTLKDCFTMSEEEFWSDVPLDCTHKSNGDYPLGFCHEEYVHCSDGKLQKRNCASNYVYASGSALPGCTHFRQIPLCARHKHVDSFYLKNAIKPMEDDNCIEYRNIKYCSKPTTTTTTKSPTPLPVVIVDTITTTEEDAPTTTTQAPIPVVIVGESSDERTTEEPEPTTTTLAPVPVVIVDKITTEEPTTPKPTPAPIPIVIVEKVEPTTPKPTPAPIPILVIQ